MTRGWRALALMVFVAGLLATPLGGRALDRACAATAVHVAVVVDAGSAGGARAVCVPAGTRDNGATVLAARASMLGLPQPRYNASGLLCAIDGIPQTGCGTAHDGHYAYWAYFHGTNGNWTYNNFGPASWRVATGVVEGWRWQPDGSGLPTDPSPRGSANAAVTCVPAPPTTVARTTVPTSPRSTVATGSTSTLGVLQIPGPRTTTGAASVPPTSPTTAGSGSATTVASGSPVKSGGASPTTRATGESSSSSVPSPVRGVAAAGPAPSPSGGVPIGLVAGVLLVVGLGAGGAIAARRRRRALS
jgi:hypothetical protein